MLPPLPPRIGINAVFLEPRMGGIDSYVRALVPELARLVPASRFVVYCNPRGADYLREAAAFDPAVELRTHPLLGPPRLKALTELTVLGAIAGREVDLLHSVAMTGPLRTRAATIVMIHDVTWMVAPDPADAGTSRLWRAIVPPVARRADRVLTGSRDAAGQLVKHLGLDRDRIDVVPHAAGTGPGVAPTPAGELRERLGLGSGPLVLTVSAKRVNKNLLRVIEAMPAVLDRFPDARLVLPGNPTPHERDLRSLASRLGIDSSVVFLDYVDQADLEGLYRTASCFVFASISEGFGIPILEAMRRGVPVACANASALPEVAGDAALYFDPLRVDDLADAVVRLLADGTLAAELAERGRERERLFTWEATAQLTLESYARAWRQARGGAPVSRAAEGRLR